MFYIGILIPITKVSLLKPKVNGFFSLCLLGFVKIAKENLRETLEKSTEGRGFFRKSMRTGKEIGRARKLSGGLTPVIFGEIDRLQKTIVSKIQPEGQTIVANGTGMGYDS